MLKKISAFIDDETGAVTVDWVVLTAAIVTLSIAVVLLLRPALDTSAGVISTNVVNAVVAALP